MSYILGAAVMIAALTLLHFGRQVVQRMDAVGAPREALVLDVFALGFTALFAMGLMLAFADLAEDATLWRLAAFVAALIGTVVGAKLVGAAFRHAAARRVARPAPMGGARAA